MFCLSTGMSAPLGQGILLICFVCFGLLFVVVFFTALYSVARVMTIHTVDAQWLFVEERNRWGCSFLINYSHPKTCTHVNSIHKFSRVSGTWVSSEARHCALKTNKLMWSPPSQILCSVSTFSEKGIQWDYLYFSHPFDSLEFHLPNNIESMCFQERTKTFSRCSCQFWWKSYFYPVWAHIFLLVLGALGRGS